MATPNDERIPEGPPVSGKPRNNKQIATLKSTSNIVAFTQDDKSLKVRVDEVMDDNDMREHIMRKPSLLISQSKPKSKLNAASADFKPGGTRASSQFVSSSRGCEQRQACVFYACPAEKRLQEVESKLQAAEKLVAEADGEVAADKLSETEHQNPT